MREVTLVLLVAHLVGDFVLQSSAQVEGKRVGRWRSFAEHGIIHWLVAVVLFVIFVPPVAGSSKTHLVLLLLVAGHLGVDACKLWVQERWLPHRAAGLFVGDQVAHMVLVLAAAAAIVGNSPATLFQPLHAWLLAHRGSLLTAAAIFIAVVFAGGFLIQLLLTPFRPASAATGGEPAQRAHGMPNAGMYIGWLERSIVMTAIVMGEHTLVGLVIAAKAIIRFKETDLDFAEYFLLGTFLSLLLAGSGALLFRAFVGPIAL